MRAQTGGDGGNGHRFYQHPSPMTVRYVYAVLFLLANILFEGQRRSGCHGDHDCLAAACSYMEPQLVGAYSVFLCFAAITSEPEIDCYKKGKAVVNWKTMISFVFELTSTAASAFSTGSDYKCIQLRNVAESEDDVPYGYGWTSAWVHIVVGRGPTPSSWAGTGIGTGNHADAAGPSSSSAAAGARADY